MNVRDFLFNFVSPTARIRIEKVVDEQILFYGRADDIDRLQILNRMVECVSYDTKAECLIIRVRNIAEDAVYHLPVNMNYVY